MRTFDGPKDNRSQKNVLECKLLSHQILYSLLQNMFTLKKHTQETMPNIQMAFLAVWTIRVRQDE